MGICNPDRKSLSDRMARGRTPNSRVCSRTAPQPTNSRARIGQRGGRVRAEKMRRRKELRERFEVAHLDDLAAAELELLDQALVRLNLLLASEDHRVALRACIEVFDRVLGRPRQQVKDGHSFAQRPDMETALARACEKLALRLDGQAQAL
jgi:hypothetical protein